MSLSITMLKCKGCERERLIEDFSNKQYKAYISHSKQPYCRECIELKNQAIKIQSAQNKLTKPIKEPRKDCEIIEKGQIHQITTDETLSTVLQQIIARNGRQGITLICDLHNTFDQLQPADLAKLQQLRLKFAQIVICSFVGKNNSPDSMYTLAKRQIGDFIDMGVIDYGVLVFERHYAKARIVGALYELTKEQLIAFVDDSEDHIQNAKRWFNEIYSQHKLKLFLFQTKNADQLMSWIENLIE